MPSATTTTVERVPTNASSTSLASKGVSKTKLQLGKLKAKITKSKKNTSKEPLDAASQSEPQLEPNGPAIREVDEEPHAETAEASPTPSPPAQQPVSPPQQPPSSNPDSSSSPDPSAATLARRIHSLLSSSPPFYNTPNTGSNSRPGDNAAADPNAATDGSNLPDSKLLALLSSASAMNGSISKGRQSVWDLLERLSLKPASNAKESVTMSDTDSIDNHSIMLCGPLNPTDDSQVELAQSEIVSIASDDRLPDNAVHAEFLGWPWWPFGKKQPASDTPAGSTSPANGTTQVRVWIPSRTKVSLQAAWWGFRIYLPPPVVQELNNSSSEAAKMATILTTALTWLVNNVPASILPPPLQPVLTVLKGLVPVVGYVSGFIAWSWSTVKSFDQGQGIILSATWLLPIALIPSTWNYQPTTPGAPTTSQPSAPSTSPTAPSTSPTAPSTSPSAPTAGTPTAQPSAPTTSQPSTGTGTPAPTQPTNPAPTQPAVPAPTQPSAPTTQPSAPTTQPSATTTQPSAPTTQPSAPTPAPSAPSTTPAPVPPSGQPSSSTPGPVSNPPPFGSGAKGSK